MPRMERIAQDVAIIHDFLAAEECDEQVRFSEGIGFAEATVNTDLGHIMLKELRNNERVILDDAARATLLWERLRPLIPARFKKKWTGVGLNERLRFYRYDPGQLFDWHQDGFFERDSGERSFFTFMIYLNDGFEGGDTSFNPRRSKAVTESGFRVHPRKGMALMFHHPIPHRGDPVARGRKYVLRTDVMYAEVAPDAAAPIG